MDVCAVYPMAISRVSRCSSVVRQQEEMRTPYVAGFSNMANSDVFFFSRRSSNVEGAFHEFPKNRALRETADHR